MLALVTHSRYFQEVLFAGQEKLFSIGRLTAIIVVSLLDGLISAITAAAVGLLLTFF